MLWQCRCWRAARIFTAPRWNLAITRLGGVGQRLEGVARLRRPRQADTSTGVDGPAGGSAVRSSSMSAAHARPTIGPAMNVSPTLASRPGRAPSPPDRVRQGSPQARVPVALRFGVRLEHGDVAREARSSRAAGRHWLFWRADTSTVTVSAARFFRHRARAHVTRASDVSRRWRSPCRSC